VDEERNREKVAFHTGYRFGLPDVTLCHSGGSGNAGVISVIFSLEFTEYSGVKAEFLPLYR